MVSLRTNERLYNFKTNFPCVENVPILSKHKINLAKLSERRKHGKVNDYSSGNKLLIICMYTHVHVYECSLGEYMEFRDLSVIFTFI